jgi:hypothetical protein
MPTRSARSNGKSSALALALREKSVDRRYHGMFEDTDRAVAQWGRIGKICAALTLALVALALIGRAWA